MSTNEARRQLDRLIDAHGLLGASRALQQLSRASLRLEPAYVEAEAVPVGTTQLGGQPTMPSGLDWPHSGRQPLAFLAQVRLSELSRQDVDGLLPAQGMLWFFYDLEGAPVGQSPQDKAGFRILHEPDESIRLERKAPPKRAPRLGGAARVRASAEPTLPPEESHEAQVLDLTPDQWDAYYELLSSLEATEDVGRDTRHKMLGYSDLLQGDLRLDCQMVSAGLDCRDDASFRDPRVQQLDQGIVEWQLLLQLDEDEKLGLDLGGGRLYFLVRLPDLRAGRFEGAWAIRQEPYF
jgi:uncharacterized protein YwqG